MIDQFPVVCTLTLTALTHHVITSIEQNKKNTFEERKRKMFRSKIETKTFTFEISKDEIDAIAAEEDKNQIPQERVRQRKPPRLSSFSTKLLKDSSIIKPSSFFSEKKNGIEKKLVRERENIRNRDEEDQFIQKRPPIPINEHQFMNNRFEDEQVQDPFDDERISLTSDSSYDSLHDFQQKNEDFDPLNDQLEIQPLPNSLSSSNIEMGMHLDPVSFCGNVFSQILEKFTPKREVCMVRRKKSSLKQLQPDFAIFRVNNEEDPYDIIQLKKKWYEAELVLDILEPSSTSLEKFGSWSDNLIAYTIEQLSHDFTRVFSMCLITNLTHLRVCISTRSSLQGIKSSFSKPVPFIDGQTVSDVSLIFLTQVLERTKHLCTKQLLLKKCGYSFIESLGIGSTSVNAKAVSNDDEMYSVKIVDFSSHKTFQTELKVFEMLSESLEESKESIGLPKLFGFDLDLQLLATKPIGRSLNKIPWGTLRTGDLFVSIVQALKMLHERNIMHRDVSPGNIVLVHQGEKAISQELLQHRLYLIDFGTCLIKTSPFGVGNK